MAANSALPKGSLPGTMKTTSSAMRLKTVFRSLALLASIQVSIKALIARSSSVMKLSLETRSLSLPIGAARVRTAAFQDSAMHDIKLIRDDPVAFDDGLKRRGLAPSSAE